MNEYIVELPNEIHKTCKLDFFFAALEFVKNSREFSIADLHRHLKCRYGTVGAVLDALCLLNVIEKISEPPKIRYRSLILGAQVV